MTDINDCWRRDIENAPKSYYAKTDYVAAGKDRSLTTIVDIYIIAAYPGPKQQIGKIKWLPDEERWEMFVKGQEPVAWMHYPTHPDAA